MINQHNKISTSTNFFGNTTPDALIKTYGSPLYVYNETIFRSRCQEMRDLVDYDNFKVNYSVKANGNLSLIKIAREEGLYVDAMSPGEIYVEEMAGFKPEEILFISNNVSAEEMQFAIDRGILVSVDSIPQLALYGQLNPGGKVCIRFNPGIGAGHHEKVITAGKKTKFGVAPEMMDAVNAVLAKYNLTVAGINQHIGSLFMTGEKYVAGIQSVLNIAKQFKNLEFVDFGGGFGIPYEKLNDQPRLDLAALKADLQPVLEAFVADYGRKIQFKIEPGRYISAESAILLGSVHVKKQNYDTTYIGTDLGFNVLQRPVMYDSHHDIEVYRSNNTLSTKMETVTVVGNICETGDIMAKDRVLPEIFEGDILGVCDAGAYGFCMASSYNNRLRPAEVLIQADGTPKLIRRRETFDDLVKAFDC